MKTISIICLSLFATLILMVICDEEKDFKMSLVLAVLEIMILIPLIYLILL